MVARNLEHIIRDAENYGQLVIQAFATCPKKKKNTPISRIKVPLKNVKESVTTAKLLGELSATERILIALKNELNFKTFSCTEDYYNVVIGELQLYLMDVNNVLAKRGNHMKAMVTLEDIVEDR